MDPRERFAGDEEALRTAFQGMRTGLWTCLPGIIQSFNTDDPGNVTAVVQPAIQGVIQSPDGSYQAVNLPLLPDVPVVFPRGGGCTLTFPIQPGDECLVVFSSRCIDGWWQSGGVQLPMEPRMHDLSDGFAILGPQSKPNKIQNISTDSVQLRSDDGEAFVSINPQTHDVQITTSGDASVQADGKITLTGDVTITGNLSVNGDVRGDGSATFDGDVTGDGVSLRSHKHTLVKLGTDKSGPPG